MSTREKLLSTVEEMPDEVLEAIAAMWMVLRKNTEPDYFWTEERRQRVLKSISDYENGITKPVYKTMEELEAYEN
jgi:hypothetical protein